MKQCPLFDMCCPYCLTSGECTLTHPKRDCDDYYAMIGDEEE